MAIDYEIIWEKAHNPEKRSGYKCQLRKARYHDPERLKLEIWVKPPRGLRLQYYIEVTANEALKMFKRTIKMMEEGVEL